MKTLIPLILLCFLIGCAPFKVELINLKVSYGDVKEEQEAPILENEELLVDESL